MAWADYDPAFQGEGVVNDEDANGALRSVAAWWSTSGMRSSLPRTKFFMGGGAYADAVLFS
jgi:hypothetical protein